MPEQPDMSKPHTERPKACGTIGCVPGSRLMILTEAHSLPVWSVIAMSLSLLCSLSTFSSLGESSRSPMSKPFLQEGRGH